MRDNRFDSDGTWSDPWPVPTTFNIGCPSLKEYQWSIKRKKDNLTRFVDFHICFYFRAFRWASAYLIGFLFIDFLCFWILLRFVGFRGRGCCSDSPDGVLLWIRKMGYCDRFAGRGVVTDWPADSPARVLLSIRWPEYCYYCLRFASRGIIIVIQPGCYLRLSSGGIVIIAFDSPAQLLLWLLSSRGIAGRGIIIVIQPGVIINSPVIDSSAGVLLSLLSIRQLGYCYRFASRGNVITVIDSPAGVLS